MSGYIGVSNSSKKISKLYIGVDNTSRKVSKAYIGVGGVSKLWYQGIDPTKTSLTEDEFIQICQAGLQSQMTIGAIITLANSYQTSWEVIGVNHDGTSGTVDLMSHYAINLMAFHSTMIKTYNGSDLHTFCNSTVPNAFTNATTKSLLKTMSVITNVSASSTQTTTLTGQYGKALSLAEINYTGVSHIAEGSSYGLSNYMWRVKQPSGSTDIWTRSWYMANSFFYVYNDEGYAVSTKSYYMNKYTLPVVRF